MLKFKNNFHRKLIIFLIIILTIIIAFFAIQKRAKILDGSRLKVIDNIGKNYIIRGSNPFIKNEKNEEEFSYLELKKFINKTLLKDGKKPIADFYLIDVSLLNIDGYFQIQKEQNFFANNPQIGEVINHSEIAPELLLMPLSNKYPQNKILQIVTENYHKKLHKILEDIHQKLTTQKDQPTIIYIHCNAGRDRTGVISATYRMLYKGMNLSQALNQNIIDVKRSSEYLLNDATISFCNYLKRQSKSGYYKNEDFCLHPQ